MRPIRRCATLQTGRVRGTANVTWLVSPSTIQPRDLETTSLADPRWSVMAHPGWTTNVSSAPCQPRTRISGAALQATTMADVRASGTFSIRCPRYQFVAFLDRVTEPQQYISTLAGGRPETYNSRYVFAFIDRSTMSMEFRLGLTLRPDLNFDVYAEPFAASGHYYDYGELLAPASRERLTYGTNGTTLTINPDGSQIATAGGSTIPLRNRDFNTLSFRSNVVLRWEWRAGSTLYVVWQQDRADSRVLGTRVAIHDALRSVTAPGSNIFLVKMSFWVPVK